MRVAVLLLAAGALVAIALAACAANNDSGADTTAGDSARVDATTNDTLASADDSITDSPSRSRSSSPPRAVSADRDSSPLPQDSLRAMRPTLPQVVPDSQPGRWRGLKLPERRPVRPPIEPIRATEQAPDSVMKGDSTRPPGPGR